ncbi:sensor histidine kinase [Croceivirga thetidis]|uniref:Histidine kinase n=1 Tax=Croceivirga thetidis TaxID=2721623 RepID=A0ABX1GT38_9FLAO|nr:histidine kinase [Croceivirga thetidis]NKI33128.1 histidine kinase [Croceivirga thetidis]
MMNRIVIWGIRVKELLALLVLYIFSSWAYHIVIWLNYPLEKRSKLELFNLVAYMDSSGLQYIVFFLFTIPIWWFIFRGLRKESLWVRISAHLVLLPSFVLLSKYAYYNIAEFVGLYHLNGSGEIWDIYIPALFYQIQFAIFHVYEYFIENQKKLKLQGELRQAALKSELAAIKAQLNPHFLYNVFNTINASVPPKQEKTRRMIATLSDLFRYQLKASKKELVSLEEELEFVKNYLELEKARFEERLNIKIDVPQNLYSEKIPPMLLQPLVENSVKHGISNTLQGGEISISIFKEEGKLKFEIADTGKGVTDKKSLFGKGIGLSNTQLRLQKMYQSQLEILDNHPQGLKIRFAI